MVLTKEKKQRKQFLEEKMEEGRFLPITDELFGYYDEYRQLCESEDAQNDLLTLYFYRGETCFRMGKYEDALQLLGECLIYENQEISKILIVNCYNILGLIYSSMGYQFMALKKYLQGLDTAVEAGDIRKKAVIQVNIGWLYRDLGAYEKSAEYYKTSIKDLENRTEDGGYNLTCHCYAYLGQLYFRMGKEEEGVKILRKIEQMMLVDTEIFYNVVVWSLGVLAYTYLDEPEKLAYNKRQLIEAAENEEDFLELNESYFSICEFITEHDRENARKFLNALHKPCDKLEIPFLKLRLQMQEVLYSEKYESHEKYLEACSEYIVMNRRYEAYNKQSQISNMATIEMLQKVKKERAHYLEESRHDLMTGLLNKVSFEERIRSLLEMKGFENGTCAMAVMDIDYFKEVNDNYGHMVGDEVLTKTAHFMKTAFDEGVVLGRIGGDEFSVFWPDAGAKELVENQIEKMRQLFQEGTLAESEKNCKPTISIGISYASGRVNYEEIFKKADQCLYEAKKSGRNAVFRQIFESVTTKK